MDGWLKAKAAEVAKAAADAADSASKLGNELADQASHFGNLLEGSAAGTRNLQFEAGVLGFQLDGACVAGVDKGGQASKLGVCVGDSLVAVAGYEVPTPAEDDVDAVQRRNRQIKKWIKEAPRPVRLTFKAIDAPSCDDQGSGEVAAAHKTPEPTADLEAELDLDDAFASLLLEESGEAESVETMLHDADSSALHVELEPDSEILKSLAAEAAALEDSVARSTSDGTAVRPGDAEAAAVGSCDSSPEKQPLATEGRRSEVSVEMSSDPSSRQAQQDSLVQADPTDAEMERHLDETQLVAVSKLEALQAELLREQEQRAHLSTELIQARHSRARVNADLETERRQNAAAKKNIVELQAQVVTLTEQCSELRRTVDSSQKDERIELEASEAREQVLEDEVSRLRAACTALETSNKADLQAEEEKTAVVEARVAELQEMFSRQTDEAHVLVARAVAAEGEKEIAESNLRRAQEERAAEQSKLQAEHQQALAVLQQQLTCQEEQALSQLQEAKLEIASLRQAAADAVQPETVPEPQEDELEEIELDMKEGDDAGQTSGSVAAAALEIEETAICVNDEEAESGEVVILRQRLSLVEQRCVTLQKQLNARPIVFQKPKSLNGRDDRVGSRSNATDELSWEPYLRAAAGPLITAAVVRLYNIPDRALRNFTQKLLQHDAWLWVFYAHLLVLYTIAASCYATVNTSNNPVDAINAGVAQAVATGSGAVSGKAVSVSTSG